MRTASPRQPRSNQRMRAAAVGRQGGAKKSIMVAPSYLWVTKRQCHVIGSFAKLLRDVSLNGNLIELGNGRVMMYAMLGVEKRRVAWITYFLEQAPVCPFFFLHSCMRMFLQVLQQVPKISRSRRLFYLSMCEATQHPDDRLAKDEGARELTSIHSDQIQDIHQVPMDVIIRPLPSILEEEKVQSLIRTLQVTNWSIQR